MAATQRPVAELAFSEPSGPPAWKSSPAWAVVATGDKAAGTDVIRSMAERAGATITEVEGSHVIMVSQPGAVADVILTAAAAVARPAAATAG
jgi:Alpha/beta hydrolase family